LVNITMLTKLVTKRPSGYLGRRRPLGFSILLLIGTMFAIQAQAAEAAATTINGLQKISVVGQTDTIFDAQGNTITVDADPYKIAVGPSGDFSTGDILVSNVEGTTIVKFSGQQGPGRQFNAP